MPYYSRVISRVLAAAAATILMQSCGQKSTGGGNKSVPHQERYGIYALNLVSQDVSLIYSSPMEIFGSTIALNSSGTTLLFAQKFDCVDDTCMEICAVGVNGQDFRRITSNGYWDLYPAWSPDGGKIAWLTRRGSDLDIYVMNSNGANPEKFYDSGTNDADVDWKGDGIVFTSGCRIWRINGDGTNPTALTNPARVCEWGSANLPFGDYDPRLSDDGANVVFERLEGDNSVHGNYNLFVINSDGTGETRLTSTGYAQGLANWSHAGDRIVFLVAAIGNTGKYRLYMMNADGTDNHDVTPGYFPVTFLCHAAVFSQDDTKLFFIGEWWQ